MEEVLGHSGCVGVSDHRLVLRVYKVEGFRVCRSQFAVNLYYC